MCTFVGCDGSHKVGTIGRAAEYMLECLLVFFDARDLCHGGIQAWLAHLKGIDDRLRRLLLERIHPAVPELRLIVEGIQNGRCVALAEAAFDTDGQGLPVGECELRIMACAARDRAVNRQTAFEEKFLAQGNFLGALRIVRRNCLSSQLRWRTNLLKRLRLRQGIRFRILRSFRAHCFGRTFAAGN